MRTLIIISHPTIEESLNQQFSKKLLLVYQLLGIIWNQVIQTEK